MQHVATTTMWFLAQAQTILMRCWLCSRNAVGIRESCLSRYFHTIKTPLLFYKSNISLHEWYDKKGSADSTHPHRRLTDNGNLQVIGQEIELYKISENPTWTQTTVAKLTANFTICNYRFGISITTINWLLPGLSQLVFNFWCRFEISDSVIAI